MTDPRHEKKTIKVQGAPSSRAGQGEPGAAADAPQAAQPGPAHEPDAAPAKGAEPQTVHHERTQNVRRSSPHAAFKAAAAAAAAAKPAGDAQPAAPADATTERLAAVAAERDDYVAHLQRLQAEFDNYRKRVQRDNESLVLRAGEGVVESLLPVMDNIERALDAAAKHDADQLVDGVERVATLLRSVLESHGLEEVPAEPGVPFDPTVHEAVLTQPSDEYPEGMIARVLERGYLLHGRLLRPTRVIVTA